MKIMSMFLPVANLSADEVRKYMEEHPQGSYTLLDVRQKREYEKERIPGAKLIPLTELSDRYEELNRLKPVIVYCASGGRSRVAAKMLKGEGFNEVYNLKGGIRAWQGAKAAGPPEMGMEFVPEIKNLQDIICLAYGMEESMERFYEEASGKTGDEDAARLLTRLGAFEKGHKNMLFELYRKIAGEDMEMTAFEKRVIHGVLEGGLSTEEYLERITETEHGIEDIFSVAMMFEAQAMDLYMRYSEEMEDTDARRMLHELAQQEKEHLISLGEMMDSKV